MAATQTHAEKTAVASSLRRRHVPDDLQRDILSRLPVKSLLRFRCVSKPWLSLVDDDADFALLHLNTFKNNRDETGLIVIQSRRECVVRCSDTFKLKSKIPSTLLPNYQDVVSSHHGLILLLYQAKTTGQFCDLKVWNPSIRKLHEIPPLLKPEVPESSFVMDRDIGLGYDPITNDYKHVKLIFINETLDAVAIYSLVANSWRIIKFEDKGSACSNWHWDVYGSVKTVYFRSSFYFVAKDEHEDKGWDLVWFDLSKEVFCSISMPDDPYLSSSYHNWHSLTSVDDGSSLVVFDRYSSVICAWALDRESMCWTKLHLYALEGCYNLHIKKNGDMLTWKVYTDTSADETGGEKLVLCDEVGSYSRETEEHKTLLRQHDSITFHVFCYVESLILHRIN